MGFLHQKSWVFGFKHHYLNQIFDCHPSGANWAWLTHSDWGGSNQLTFTLRTPVFDIFLGCFWLGCLEILLLAMLVSLEALAVKKSPKIPLWNFWTFFSFFFQMAVDCVKMIFQTPNKGLTCFKHYKFLIFDEKQVPPKKCSTYLQISLVPCS